MADRVQRWSGWFRDRIRSGVGEAELISQFASYEHEELREGGASEGIVEDYETADPSRMAVPAAGRYWAKYHPDAVKG